MVRVLCRPYRDGPASGENISHLCRLGIWGYFGIQPSFEPRLDLKKFFGDPIEYPASRSAPPECLKLSAFLMLTNIFYVDNTDPFVAWFAVTGDTTPDGIPART